MTTDLNKPRFFIALVPPIAIQDYATEVIRELGDRYQMSAAKAPPHVTLQPPFRWSMEQVSLLEQCLQTIANRHSRIPVSLSGFGSFPPRVLYINVLKTSELLALQRNLMQELEATLGIVDPKSKQRPFAPHLTVASRDVTRQTFQQAWADLQPRSVEFQFVGDRLTLLIHNGHQWQVQAEFYFT